MPDSYLSYFGIRVRDLDRSLRFYSQVFGLREVDRGDKRATGDGVYVLLRDEWSGQKLELNWYPPGSRHATPYAPGEGLDHVAFRVNDVPPFLSRLRREGVEGTGGYADHQLPDGTRVAYITDPDGNWIEIYDAPVRIGTGPPNGY